jgi:hypothetical protein
VSTSPTAGRIVVGVDGSPPPYDRWALRNDWAGNAAGTVRG